MCSLSSPIGDGSSKAFRDPGGEPGTVMSSFEPTAINPVHTPGMARLQEHPAGRFVPLMEDTDFQVLKESIALYGLTHAIVLYEGKILDGRHRYRACCELGIEPCTEEYQGDSPVTYVYTTNVPRRELSCSERVALALKILPQLELEAADRKSKGGLASIDAKGKATEKAAKLMGVSSSSIERAQRAGREAEKLEARGDSKGAESVRAAAKKSPHAGAKAAKIAATETKHLKALERISSVLGNDIREGIEQSTLPHVTKKEAIWWASLEDEEMKKLEGYVTQNRWAPTESLRFLDEVISSDTRILHLLDRCTGEGGSFQCVVNDHTVTVEVATAANCPF